MLNSESLQKNEFNDKIFRFESFWLSNENCNNVVADSWNAFLSSSVETKHEHCATSLKDWAMKSFGEIKHGIKVTEKKLAKAQRCSPDANMIAACNSLALDLDELHRIEEAYWHLRSRVNELRDGDSNKKYFHHKASSRKKRNLRGLEDSNGVWQTSKVDIEHLISEYFENIFATMSPVGFSKALEGLHRLVTDDMNSILDFDPTHEEICLALFQMHPTKAPGFDGFHAIFFHKF